jgi:hypothetical protein
VDSELFERALDTPCGCQKLDEADKESDPNAAESLRSIGNDAATRWRCPRYTGEPAPEQPSEDVRGTLIAVERLTGAKGLTTCPCWHASQQAVQVAACARQWAERGLLRERYGEPSLALMQGIELIDTALAARDREERKAREKKQQ